MHPPILAVLAISAALVAWFKTQFQFCPYHGSENVRARSLVLYPTVALPRVGPSFHW